VEEFRYDGNELVCEESRLLDCAATFGTPLYVYSRRSIIDHCRTIERAFGTADHLSCYAVKANANRTILRLLAGEGIGADVGSLGELRLALEAGFPPQKITFSGVGKRDEEITAALEAGILALSVESREELEVIAGLAARLGRRAPILLRVTLDIPTDTHPYVTTGRTHNKFGLGVAGALEALGWARRSQHLEVLGLHSHIGSQITDSAALRAAAERLVALTGQVRESGVAVKQINFGGGFGVQYRDYVTHPSLPLAPDAPDAGITTVKLLQAVLGTLRTAGCTIAIQPGRSIVAHAGILLTKVVYRKESGGKQFIVVDAGMNDLIRPSLYHSYHQIVPVRIDRTETITADIVGPLCETGDFLALDRDIPDVRRGDVLAVMCAGAYGYVLASNYNGRARPAEVMVDGAGTSVITPRESLDELFR
jgi:diaminopimelate decarboxylase